MFPQRLRAPATLAKDVAQSSDNLGPTLSEHPRTPGSSARSKRCDREQTTTSLTPESDSTSRPRSLRGYTHHSATEMTARAALEASGQGRLRILTVSMLALAMVGILTVIVFDAALMTKWLAGSSLVALVALFGVTWLRAETIEARPRAREPRADDAEPAFVRAVLVALCIAVVVCNFAFGLASVFCVAVALGILLFASSADRANATLAYAILAGGFLLAAVIVHMGWYPYPPIASVSFPKIWMWDATIGLVEIMYLAAFAAGRMIRHEQARVVHEFEKAVREASMRDALLREARDALKNAAGIGAPGRFTDQELDGFRLGPVIGRGGMGEVYAAERLSDGKEAALKLLRMDALGERSALSRFEREARIIGSIQSSNVVQVLGVSNADSVLPYIAMEKLSGVDLASYLRNRGRLPLIEVVDLVSQVAVGLSAAHAAKVVHRDLKPNNIFRSGSTDRPLWKILDFGVSKWMESADATLTAAELVGTPQYMAPEQARGERDLDQCADVYALAAIAYRALTGEPPFTGKMPAILKNITDDMPKAPSSAADLPRDVDLVLALGLAKQRSDRFQSAFELAAALAMASGNNLGASLVRRAKALLNAQPYTR